MKYAHLAARIFGTPLLIERHKLDAILFAVSPRIGITADVPKPAANGPGDNARERKSYFITKDGIAVINIFGPLVKRQSGAFLSGGPTTYSEIEAEFRDALANQNVKGVMLQIDSPGGETAGAFELADLIYSNRGKKPIYASADADAFSAAYLLGSSAERLYVTRSGGVGSVGVWMLHADWSKANETDGVKPTYIYAGARKIDGNPDMPLSAEARSTFQAEVDRLYGMFVDAVARNRGMSSEAVRKTEAGLYFGVNAVNVGFANAIGTIDDAMAGLRNRIKSGRAFGGASASAKSGVAKSAANPNDSPLVRWAEKLARAEPGRSPLLGACERLAGSGAERRS